MFDVSKYRSQFDLVFVNSTSHASRIGFHFLEPKGIGIKGVSYVYLQDYCKPTKLFQMITQSDKLDINIHEFDMLIADFLKYVVLFDFIE